MGIGCNLITIIMMMLMLMMMMMIIIIISSSSSSSSSSSVCKVRFWQSFMLTSDFSSQSSYVNLTNLTTATAGELQNMTTTTPGDNLRTWSVLVPNSYFTETSVHRVKEKWFIFFLFLPQQCSSLYDFDRNRPRLCFNATAFKWLTTHQSWTIKHTISHAQRQG